jgi:adenylate cyclase
VYYALWGPLEKGESHAFAVLSNLGLFVVFALAISVLYRPRAVRMVAAAIAGVEDAPSPSSAAMLARLPFRLASSLFKVMMAIAVTTAAINLASSRDAGEATRVFIGLVLTACVIGALGYLISERSLRPAFTVGLGELRGDTGAIGVRLRLLLAWGVGSAVPLLFIVAIPLGQGRGDELPVEVPMVFMAVFGLVVGAVTTLAVARSVADPLDQLRGAFDRVEGGDLDVTVDVDDPGEIGRLEAGFDRMVAGLRERNRLEDLFGRHVGVDVAREALRSGVRLGGERRDVSVFFVDVIGSTQMAETRSPESLVGALNDLFRAVTQSAHAEEGWINKFEGDAALVVFGVPVHQPDHAARCLRAARDLRTRLVLIEQDVGLLAAIGVASGAVIAGNVGSEDRYEYTVIGRAVNEAARLTELAKRTPDRLLAAGPAVDAAGEERSAWRAAGSETLRGFESPIAIYSPVSA